MEITVDGRTYPVVLLDEFTWGDWREAKRIAKGILPTQFSQALNAGDPDAWYAVALISVRRVNPQAPDSLFEDTDFLAALVEWAATNPQPEEETEAESPPAGSSPTKSESGTPTETALESNTTNGNGPGFETLDVSPNSVTTPDHIGTSI